MQLLLAIVQSEDADLLCDRLTGQGFRVTRINTVGGFLERGNVTILVGVEDERVDQVMAIIRATCQTRRSFINPLPMTTEPMHPSLAVATPLEIVIGGATVFHLPVKRFARLRGGDAQPTYEFQAPVEHAPGENPMNLVLAIVQSEDADPITRALLAQGYRVTRINTAGAFLRRGNATLLVGVEEAQVDEVIRLIQANCRPREEESPIAAGMPAYSATVFVLEAAQMTHL